MREHRRGAPIYKLATWHKVLRNTVRDVLRPTTFRLLKVTPPSSPRTKGIHPATSKEKGGQDTPEPLVANLVGLLRTQVTFLARRTANQTMRKFKVMTK